MDKIVVLAVLLFLIVVDASNFKLRKLAAAPRENKFTSSQVLSKSKPDAKPIATATDQVRNNPSRLGPKPDLVSSPPEKQIRDNRINLNSTNLGSLPPFQNQIMNDEDSLKGIKNTGGVKSLKNSNNADLTMSNPDRGKVPKHANGTDLLSPSPLNEKDDGRNGGNKTDDGKTPKHVNGTDLRRPLVNEKDKDGKTPNHVNGIDFQSPSPVNEMDNGKTLKHVNATDCLSPLANEKDDRKNSGNEKDNGKSGGKETDNGKNDGVEENAIDDKSSSPVKETDNGKDGGTKEENTDDKSSSELGINETCDGLPKCEDLSGLVACIQNFDTVGFGIAFQAPADGVSKGSRKFTVLVQNDGEKTLIVNLTVPTSIENPLKPLKLSKHKAQKIYISLSAVVNNKLILNAGNGECVLHTDHPESENVFVYLPSYYKLVTPINGTYFLILSVLVFGGTWACCKVWKWRRHDGVPYQELEMGLPESIPATSVETAEVWDQGWDDNWNEDNAVKSPATRMGSISANGLASRSPNRDGWGQDWDD